MLRVSHPQAAPVTVVDESSDITDVRLPESGADGSPVKAESPVKADTPAKAESPAKEAEPPVKAESSGTAESSGVTESSGIVKTSGVTESHVEAESPDHEAKQSSDAEAPKKKAPKKLSSDEIMKKVTDLMTDLKSKETYDNKEVLTLLKGISQTYWSYKRERKAIGNRLSERGFSAHVVKMMKWFNEAGVFKTDDIWFPTYYSYNICWNYSDACRELALDLGNAGLVKMCSLNIQHSPYLDNSESKNVTYMLKSSLSILQNLSKLPELMELFEEENVKDALQPFLAHENDFFRAVATMILTSILSEEENSRLSDTGSIEFIVKAIRVALTKAKNRRYRGFSPLELVECLGRMGVNDENKKKIIGLEALPLLVIMLQGNDEEEQLAAAKTLWTLAFDKEVMERIKIEPGCTEALEKLQDSDNARVKKAAKGALWMLKDNSAPKQNKTKETAEKAKNHIFISYSWSQQAEIILIKDALKRQNIHSN